VIRAFVNSRNKGWYTLFWGFLGKLSKQLVTGGIAYMLH